MNPKTFTKSVLIVDDESFILRTTAVVLRNMGFSYVQTADTVEQALTVLSSAEPPVGLLLSDLNMPDADGLELLRRVDEQGYQGDILLFSGEDSQTLKMAESLAKARKLSVIGAIAKPVHKQNLLDIFLNHAKTTQPFQKRSIQQQILPDMLEQAIDADEIVPWFQPKIEISSRIPVGLEALARWPNSKYGPIFPDTFIPLAEKHGLIDKLTFSMVKQAARMDKLWRAQGFDLKIAVNLSMDSLHNVTIPSYLENLVTSEGGNLSDLQLEITESRLMEDLVGPLEVLLRLRMKKIKLSIDDFGTGHSNLSQLRDLPFDELKLDRSYVQPAVNSERAMLILESSVDMARKLGMMIVAEGVETLEDWERVAQLGCDQVQGYFTARPMPGSEIMEWMASWPEQSKTLFSR